MCAFIPEKYWEFSDVFLKSNFDSLPPHSEFDHAINLKDSFKPQRSKIYSISPKEQIELDAFLKEQSMLQYGPSTPTHGTPTNA